MDNKGKKNISEMVDVLDGNNRRLAVLSRESARYQGLNHRLVMVTLSGEKGKVHIRRREPEEKNYPNRLDLLASGDVLSGEAIYDAAFRAIKSKTALHPPRLELLQTIPAGPETDYQVISFFSAGRIKNLPSAKNINAKNFLSLDREELNTLTREMPELLTPGLIFAWKNNLLFSRD